MQIHFETTGCRLNQIESESGARIFLDKNFSVGVTPFTAKTEIDVECVLCVLNTCAVTQKAEQKDRRLLRLLLEKCPNATVVVTGCYAQLSPTQIEAINPRIASLPGQLKSRIGETAELLEKQIRENNFKAEKFAEELKKGLFAREQQIKDFSENAFMLSTDSFLSHSRSSIKIQDGCNCACSYCTIHIARGKSVSLDVEKVLDRIIQLEKAGQSEVVFTSVNISQYKGVYKDGFLDFTGLLKLCLEKTEKIAFRISSIYPQLVTEDFCEVIKDSRVRPHFHISVQSGSDAVLKAMARGYKAQAVLEACKMLKKAKENPFLACDIITGFPGETDEDFNDSVRLFNEAGFAWAHVFPFSERPGTPACTMKNKVPQSLRDQRAKTLAEIASEAKKNYISSVVGKEFYAVLETVRNPKLLNPNSSEKIRYFHAVTENFLHCELCVSDSTFTQGSLVKVKITGAKQSLSKGGEIDCSAVLV